MNKISRLDFEAVIFDLDGVITQSAKIHALAWKEMFDPFLSKRGQPPFDIQKDYYTHVDGKPRLDGIRSFLQSRKIDLPEEMIHALGERKNAIFLKQLKLKGVDVYQTSVELVKELKKQGIKVAIVSSSKNCSAILESAGIRDLFDTQVDGEMHLKGKPAPDIFLKAAEKLNVAPEKAIIVEDSLAGVQAGRAGGFGCVIGVDRGNQADALKNNGANLVVSDLEKIKLV